MLELSRAQILNFRLEACSLLEERLPGPGRGPDFEASLRRAAWAGLQDSMPRAALLSLHARVAGVRSDVLEHPSLVQIWGPRFNVYTVSLQDLAIFSLGRLPDGARGKARAIDTAAKLHDALEGRRMPFGSAGKALGVPPNSLRYASATGTLLMQWDGARQPTIWTVPAPSIPPTEARLELARRYLHIFGPASPASFRRWAGIGGPEANAAFAALSSIPVRGGGSILSEDEDRFRAKNAPRHALARLLPSGDAFYLAWGADRHLLVPDLNQQQQLWTTRVWPGALLVRGEIAGIWRRSASNVSITAWRKLTKSEREAAETEARSLPLPGGAPASVIWT